MDLPVSQSVGQPVSQSVRTPFFSGTYPFDQGVVLIFSDGEGRPFAHTWRRDGSLQPVAAGELIEVFARVDGPVHCPNDGTRYLHTLKGLTFLFGKQNRGVNLLIANTDRSSPWQIGSPLDVMKTLILTAFTGRCTTNHGRLFRLRIIYLYVEDNFNCLVVLEGTADCKFHSIQRFQCRIKDISVSVIVFTN